MLKLRPFILACALPLALTGCSDPPPLNVVEGSVRLNPNPNAPSAAYFTIRGGSEPVVLRDVRTEAAVRIEMHESVTKDGVASMNRLETIDVPAGETVKLEPGGKHIMLWSINPQVIEAGKMSFTFIFSNGARIIADAAIQQPGGGGATDMHEGH